MRPQDKIFIATVIYRQSETMASGINLKKWALPLVIVAFVLVLFFNTYFNATSGIAVNEDATSLTEKFYLSGPDPYYNARLIEDTLESGEYPYLGGEYGTTDPLLNYPLGRSGGRPPLFNMITMGVGGLFSPVMGEVDALGFAMQFLPALYGALLVFPVYVIGSRLFDWKAGLVGAFMVALIPIHLGSGHGSAFSLYDHDSLVLLLTTTTMMFLTLSLTERHDRKSMLYAFMGGVSIAAMSMTWVSGQYIYALVAVYAVAQMFVDIVSSRINLRVPRTVNIALLGGYLVALPFFIYKQGLAMTTELAVILGVVVFSGIYLWLRRQNIPWVVSIPSIFGLGGIALVFLYLIRNTTIGVLQPFTRISDIIYGAGIYGKKVSATIAEASTFDFSRNVMSFGPVLFWLAWIGFMLLAYRVWKDRSRRGYFLLIMWLLVETWLLSTAGRFLNNLVPIMAILGGWILWMTIDKLNFKDMVATIRGVGGGWYGFKKGVKIRHVVGVVFIVFFVFVPNGWMAFDASLPSTMKQDFNSDKLGAFGLGLHTEEYWTDAFGWLERQEQNMSNVDKPAVISWWDYGFYEVAIAKHPTVADNFQDGIPPAANFQTAESEQAAVSIWLVRLAEGDMQKHDGELSAELKDVFDEHLGNLSDDLVTIIETPKEYANTTYDDIISKQYGGEKYRVRAENARYHDATRLLTGNLTDEELTWLYHDVQDVTGNSIRYYAVEGYDVNIFNVFTFLADKGTFGYETSEDRYFNLWYTNESGLRFTPEEVRNMTQQERQQIGQLTPHQERKQPFYNSMVYRSYLGSSVPKQIFENQTQNQQYLQYLYMLMRPTQGFKHFSVEYVSPMDDQQSLYFARGQLCRGCPAVVIAKYYEGARVNGTLVSEGEPIDGATVTVQQTVTMFNQSRSISHDSTVTDASGHFSVIAPAGNISLSISQGSGQNQVQIKTITFNGTGERAPITEDEAMRRGDWRRDLGVITIQKGSVEGMAYWDKDGNNKYNASVDEPMSNVDISVGGKSTSTNARGEYEIRSLLPDAYTMSVTRNGYEVTSSKQVGIKPNQTITKNLSLAPAKVTVSGAAWLDLNDNGRRDANETVPNVPIDFTVLDAPDQNAKNTTAEANETGYYTKNLSPGTYRVSVNATSNGTRYVYSHTITIDIGDGPRTLNIEIARAD
jgi:dolichyl-diphosphooligosaccharide--protein glycosyltransferase